jgi:hypothetical protein
MISSYVRLHHFKLAIAHVGQITAILDVMAHLKCSISAEIWVGRTTSLFGANS